MQVDMCASFRIEPLPLHVDGSQLRSDIGYRLLSGCLPSEVFRTQPIGSKPWRRPTTHTGPAGEPRRSIGGILHTFIQHGLKGVSRPRWMSGACHRRPPPWEQLGLSVQMFVLLISGCVRFSAEKHGHLWYGKRFLAGRCYAWIRVIMCPPSWSSPGWV